MVGERYIVVCWCSSRYFNFGSVVSVYASYFNFESVVGQIFLMYVGGLLDISILGE